MAQGMEGDKFNFSPKRKGLNAFLSFTLHASIGLLLFVSSIELFKELFENKNQQELLLKESVRVDIVAMPKFTLKELKTMQTAKTNATSEEKTNSLPTTSDVVEDQDGPESDVKILKKKKGFMDSVKELSQKKIQGERRRNNQNQGNLFENVDQSQLNQLVNEGNKISKGTSLVGDGVSGEDSPFLAYVRRIRDKVKPYWKLPSYLLGKDLNCRLKIFIGSTGQLLKVEIFQTSGENGFDQRAVNAVKQAAPFDPPDKEYVKKLTLGEVVLGFPI